jgi:hypothetical protein
MYISIAFNNIRIVANTPKAIYPITPHEALNALLLPHADEAPPNATIIG